MLSSSITNRGLTTSSHSKGTSSSDSVEKDEKTTELERLTFSVHTLSIHELACSKSRNLKIAIRHVQNAVKRIFQDELRSFIELVTNGLDASVAPDLTIGNFGIGFFSTFNFSELKETGGCEILIETTYENIDGNLQTYQMSISSSLDVTFTPVKPKHHTGTSISIIPLKKAFSKEALETIEGYLADLQLYLHGHIEVSTHKETYTIGRGKRCLVTVQLSEKELKVVDTGCGIPPEIAKTKLFVPSASTKKAPKPLTGKIQLPESVKFGKTPGEKFLVSSGGVVVLNLPIELSSKSDVHLPLPSFNPVMARNALKMNPFLRSYVLKVIENSIEKLIEGELSSKILLGLYQGLQAWEEKLGESLFIEYFDQTIYHQILQNPKIIPIPYEHQAFYKKYIKAPFLPIHGELVMYDFYKVEQHVIKESRHTSTTTIAHKTVIFVEDELCSSMHAYGLMNALFVPLSFIERAKKIAAKEVLSNEQVLSFMICHRWAREGETLTPYRPTSVFGTTSTDHVTVLSSRSSLPTFSERISVSKALAGNRLHKIPPKILNACWSACGKLLTEVYYSASSVLKIQSSQMTEPQYFELVFSPVYEGELGEEALDQAIVFLSASESYLALKTPESLRKAIEYLKALKKKEIPADIAFQLFLKKDFLEKLGGYEFNRILLEQIFAYFDLTETSSLAAGSTMLWPLPSLDISTFSRLLLRMIELIKTFAIFTQDCYVKENPIVIASTRLTTLSSENIYLLDSFESKEAFLNSPIRQNLAPIIALQQMVQESSELSSPIKEEVDRYIHRTLALYRDYYTFSDASLSKTYGSSAAFKLRFIPPIVSADDVFTFILHLNKHPKRFQKVLRLSYQQNRKMLDLRLRKSLLAQSKPLPVFNIFSENALSLLTKSYCEPFMLFRRTSETLRAPIHPGIIDLIIDKAGSSPELYFLALFIQTKPLPSTDISHARVKGAFREIIDSYVKKELSFEEMETFTRFALHTQEPLHALIQRNEGCEMPKFEPMHAFIMRAALKEESFHRHPVFISKEDRQRFERAPAFCTSQILGAAQEVELIPFLLSNPFDRVVELFAKAKKKTTTHVIQQCVESGSERKCWKSALIEGLQNSVDALIELLRAKPSMALRNKAHSNSSTAAKQLLTIAFDVEIVDSEKEPAQLVLSIRDGVGMRNLKTLFADFSIPHFGEKKGLVGEMGNGSFQMYQEAEIVTIKTRLLDDPSQTYLVKIVPLRNSEGLVIDLSYKCTPLPVEETFFGTEVRILFLNRDKPKEQIAAEGVAIRSFIREVISKTTAPLPDKAPLFLELITPDSTFRLNEIDHKAPFLKIARKEDLGTSISFLPTQNKEGRGYVLTGGIPFKPLDAFLIEHKLLSPQLARKFSQGWVLSLPLGTYTPMQSRMHLKFDKEILATLKSYIAEWLYWRSFACGESTQLTTYFPYLESLCGDFTQVNPVTTSKPPSQADLLTLVQTEDESVLTTFFLHYASPLVLNESFASIIQFSYRSLVKPLNTLKSNFVMEVDKLPLKDSEEAYHQLQKTFRKGGMIVFDNWKAAISKLVKTEIQKNFVKRILIAWFEGKVETFLTETPSFETVKEENPRFFSETEAKAIEKVKIHVSKEIKDAAVAVSLIKHVITSYCTLFVKEYTATEVAPSVVLFYNPDTSASAAYNASGHVIKINLACFKPSEILTIGAAIVRREPLPAVHALTLFQIFAGSSGTLNHELEHLRRNTSHIEASAHGEAKDVYGKLVPFEACAASFIREFKAKGMYDLWAESLSDRFSEHSLDLLKVLELIKTVCTLEAENYSVFVRELVN